MKISHPKFIKQCDKAIKGLHDGIIGCRASLFGPVCVLSRHVFDSTQPFDLPKCENYLLEQKLIKLVENRLKECGLQTSEKLSPICSYEFKD